MRTGRAYAIAALLLTGACAADGGKIAADSDRPWMVDPRNVTSADDMIERADAAYTAGEFFPAADFFQRAHFLRRMEKRVDDDALMGLGRSMMAIGGYAEAAESFEAVVKIKGRYHDARVGLGYALLALGQPLVAKEHFAVAIQIQPTAGVYNGMGVAHDMVRDHVSAQQFYRAGMEIDPDDQRLRNNLGLSLALSGDSEAALVLLGEQAQGPGIEPREKLNLALAQALSGNKRAIGGAGTFDIDYNSARAVTERTRNLHALRTAWIEDGIVRKLPSAIQTAETDTPLRPASVGPVKTPPISTASAGTQMASDAAPAAPPPDPEHGATPAPAPEHDAAPAPAPEPSATTHSEAPPVALTLPTPASPVPAIALPGGAPEIAAPTEMPGPPNVTAHPPGTKAAGMPAPEPVEPPTPDEMEPATPAATLPPAPVLAVRPSKPKTAKTPKPHKRPARKAAAKPGAVAAGARSHGAVSSVLTPYGRAPSSAMPTPAAPPSATPTPATLAPYGSSPAATTTATAAPRQVLAPYRQTHGAGVAIALPPVSLPATPRVLTPLPGARPHVATRSPSGRGFQVQMGSFRERGRAGRRWTQLQRTSPGLFNGVVPMIEEARIGAARSRFYRLRTSPFGSRAGAKSFCGKLTARSIPCIVVTVRPGSSS